MLIRSAALAMTACACAVAQPASLSLTSQGGVNLGASSAFATQQFTVCTWLRPTGPGENGGGTLVSCGHRDGVGSNLCSWWMGWEAGSRRVLGLAVHQYAVSGRVVASVTTVPAGTWAHAAFTFDGVTLRMYINGVLDNQIAFGFSGLDYPASPDMHVGYFLTGTNYIDNRFQGNIDDATVWGRCLSAAEIESLVFCENPPAGSLFRLPFTDNSLADASGNGHHGSAYNTIGYGPQNPGITGQCCPADFNHDGFVDFFDADAFIEAFEAGAPIADFNGDGFIDFFDADAFVEAFEAGC